MRLTQKTANQISCVGLAFAHGFYSLVGIVPEHPRWPLATGFPWCVHLQVGKRVMGPFGNPHGRPTYARAKLGRSHPGGVLPRLVWLNIEGTGFDGFYSIYQGRLFSQKDTSGPTRAVTVFPGNQTGPIRGVNGNGRFHERRRRDSKRIFSRQSSRRLWQRSMGSRKKTSLSTLKGKGKATWPMSVVG